jgi:hypothetical protein
MCIEKELTTTHQKTRKKRKLEYLNDVEESKRKA